MFVCTGTSFFAVGAVGVEQAAATRAAADTRSVSERRIVMVMASGG